MDEELDEVGVVLEPEVDPVVVLPLLVELVELVLPVLDGDELGELVAGVVAGLVEAGVEAHVAAVEELAPVVEDVVAVLDVGPVLELVGEVALPFSLALPVLPAAAVPLELPVPALVVAGEVEA